MVLKSFRIQLANIECSSSVTFLKLITFIAHDANYSNRFELMQYSIIYPTDKLFYHPFAQKLSIMLEKPLQSPPNVPSKPNSPHFISLKYYRFSCLIDNNIAQLSMKKLSNVFLKMQSFLKWLHN